MFSPRFRQLRSQLAPLASGLSLVGAAVACFVLLASLAAFGGWSIFGPGDGGDTVTARAASQPTRGAITLIAPVPVDRTPVSRRAGDRRQPRRGGDGIRVEGQNAQSNNPGDAVSGDGGSGDPRTPSEGPSSSEGGGAPTPDPGGTPPENESGSPTQALTGALNDVVESVDSGTGGAVGGVTEVIQEAAAPVTQSPVAPFVEAVAGAVAQAPGQVPGGQGPQ